MSCATETRSCQEAGSANSSSGVSSCSSSDGVSRAAMLREGGLQTDVTLTQDMMSGPVEPRLSLVFLPHSRPQDSITNLNLYQPIIDLISDQVQILASANQNPLQGYAGPPLGRALDMPANAVVLLLQERKGNMGGGRLAKALGILTQPPWKFHHSELVSTQPRIQAYSYNSQDYYMSDDDLPLCSVRQIHHGKEHIRVVKFVSAPNWQDSISLYSRIVGQEPDVVKSDFCTFTMEQHSYFDIQFALKKLPKSVVPRSTQGLVLTFKVHDVGSLVPLLPAECYQISQTHWFTVDLDGNEIFLEQTVVPPNKLFMGKAMNTPLGAINEDMSPSQHDTCFMDTQDESMFHHNQDFHKVLTSTPLSDSHADTGRHRHRHSQARKSHHKHQHTDSGFSEGRSEPGRRADIRSALTQFCDVSLSELMSSGDDKSEGSVSQKERAPLPEVDMTVRSAYKDGDYSSVYSALPAVRNHRVPERLRPGHLHQENKVTLAELDPKQSFTQLWVMNGHHEIGQQRDVASDPEAASSCSSIDTALSDPFSDRGDMLAMKTRDKPLLPELFPTDDRLNAAEEEEEIHEEGIDVGNVVPPINHRLQHRDSSSVTSSEGTHRAQQRDSSSVASSSSGTHRKSNKHKKVSFSSKVQEHIVSPRPLVSDVRSIIPDPRPSTPDQRSVISDPRSEDGAIRAKVSSQARQAKVQSIIDRIQTPSSTTNTPCKHQASVANSGTHSAPNTPLTKAPADNTVTVQTPRDKAKQGFWI